MSVEDGAKLYDICPHVSDSVSSLASFGLPLSAPQENRFVEL